MASKKPAKKNFSNTAVQVVELPGKAILYNGVSGKKFVCPTCERTFQKGMTYEHANVQYCSRGCIK